MNSNLVTWTIVQFVEEDMQPVEAIPTMWLIGNDKAYWPNDIDAAKAIKNHYTPTETWITCKIRTFGKPYSNYTVARQMAKHAEDTSDLSSFEMEHSKRKPIPRHMSSSGSESDTGSSALPKFPKVSQGLEETRVLSNNIKLKNTTWRTLAASTNNTATVLPLNDSTDCLVSTNQNLKSGFDDLNNVQIELQEVSYPTLIPAVQPSAVSGFEKQVLRQLNLLNAKLDQQTDTINNILSILNLRNAIPENQQIDSFMEESGFPVRTKLQLDEIETKLQEGDNKKIYIQELKRIGDDSTKHFVKRVLETIFTFKFGSLYSWDGLRRKEVFSNLMVTDVIKQSALTNPKYVCTINEVEKIIKQWLRRAKEGHAQKN